MKQKENESTKELVKDIFSPDSFFEMAAQITKAHAFDILAEQVKELKQVIRKLIEVGELDELKFLDSADTEEFQALVKKANLLSI